MQGFNLPRVAGKGTLRAFFRNLGHLPDTNFFCNGNHNVDHRMQIKIQYACISTSMGIIPPSQMFAFQVYLAGV